MAYAMRNSCFSTVGGFCPWQALDGEGVHGPRGLSGPSWWLAYCMNEFRFPRPILFKFCAELGPTLEQPTSRNRPTKFPLQVLTILGFLATGTFQRELADRSGISQPSLSLVVPSMWIGIIGITQQYMWFPYTVGEQADIKAQFAATSAFPNVIGAVDCTHIGKGTTQGRICFCESKAFSFHRVQIIYDTNLILINVVARWPVSTHDSFILRHSSEGADLKLELCMMVGY